MAANDLISDNLLNEVLQRVEEERHAPLKVSIMGQSGVGKTSLVNVLFSTNLKKDPVLPATQEIVELKFEKEGHTLLFYDLPGIGESKGRDSEYIEQYRQKLRESDIVLWAIHADSRSFIYDIDALNKILETPDEKYRRDLFRKITFVLTKADLVIEDYEVSSPWVLADFGKYAIFIPQKITKDILAKKEAYLQKSFIRYYNDLIISQTFREKNFKVKVPGLTYDQDKVYYEGILDEVQVTQLKNEYPQHQAVFERLYNSYRVISCSARFRYNLDLLLEVIISKLDARASLKFGNFFTREILARIPISQARTLCNLIIINQAKQQVTFDLAKLKFPEENPVKKQPVIGPGDPQPRIRWFGLFRRWLGEKYGFL